MHRLLALVAALSLAFALSVLAAGCRGGNKPGLVKSWGKNGEVKLAGFEALQTLEDGSGRIIAVGNYNGRVAQVVRLLPDGSLDHSFGKNGIVRWPFHPLPQERYPRGMNHLGWERATLLPGGKIALAGTNSLGLVDEESTLVVSELDRSGKVVESFGKDGFFAADERLYDCPASTIGKGCSRVYFELARTRTTCTRGPVGIAVQGEKIVLSASRFCSYHDPFQIVVLRLNTNGTWDRSFGRRGEVTVNRNTTIPGRLTGPLLAYRDGRLVVVTIAAESGEVQLTGLLENGKFDTHFGREGVALTRAAGNPEGLSGGLQLYRDRRGDLTVAGSNGAGPYLLRFHRSGKPDNIWSAPPWEALSTRKSNYKSLGRVFGEVGPFFSQLSNGELVGAGDLFARITPEGAVDPSDPLKPAFAGHKILRGILAASDGTVIVKLLRYHPVPGTYTSFLARYRLAD